MVVAIARDLNIAIEHLDNHGDGTGYCDGTAKIMQKRRRADNVTYFRGKPYHFVG